MSSVAEAGAVGGLLGGLGTVASTLDGLMSDFNNPATDPATKPAIETQIAQTEQQILKIQYEIQAQTQGFRVASNGISRTLQYVVQYFQTIHSNFLLLGTF